MSEQAAWSEETVYLAEMFHDVYEVEAQKFGWKSQTPVPFNELPEANKQTMLCTVARVRGQLTAERDALKAENESLGTQVQRMVDRVCHYRFLAIKYGAKPEEMLNVYDRKLAEQGLDSDAGESFDMTEAWDEVDSLKAENATLRAKLADAAKTSDGVWEWVPKPRYDALTEENEHLRLSVEGLKEESRELRATVDRVLEALDAFVNGEVFHLENATDA